MLISLVLILCLTSCDKGEKPEVETPKIEESDKITRDTISQTLYSYAIDIYNSKDYKNYEKINGRYRITMDDLQNVLKYDLSSITETSDGFKLVFDKTYIEIDEDNIDNIDYKEYPILLTTYYD